MFSPDGSLLAVLHGSCVTLWNTDSDSEDQARGKAGEACGALTCVEAREPRELVFVGSSGRYVAVLGSQAVVVWDLARFSGTSFDLQFLQGGFTLKQRNTNCNSVYSPLARSPGVHFFPITHCLPSHSPKVCPLPVSRHTFNPHRCVWYFYTSTCTHTNVAFSTRGPRLDRGGR